MASLNGPLVLALSINRGRQFPEESPKQVEEPKEEGIVPSYILIVVATLPS